MKTIVYRVVLTIFILGLCRGVPCAIAVSPEINLKRSFQLTYQVHLKDLPADAQELRVWIPLAMSNKYQTIRQRIIQAPVHYQLARDREYGNDILFLSLRKPLPPQLDLSIQYEAVVRGQQYRIAGVKASKPSASDRTMELHLKSNRLMVVDDRMRDLAGAITAKAETPLEETQAIYRYVIERMTYEKETPGWGKGDTLRACDIGSGNCTDFHSLFISLARARGIPARFQIGLPVPQGTEGKIPGYHCWAEFHLEGIGWIPVDASEAWKDPKKFEYFFGSYDPNRLAFSTGRDIQLIPKPANGPLNIFFKPYVEVDGESFEGYETQFQFRDLTTKGGSH